MPAPKKYPDELRERAVAMVLEIRQREGGKGRGEIARVARQLGSQGGVGGRGLALVDALTEQWGADVMRWGKRVWGDLKCEAGV